MRFPRLLVAALPAALPALCACLALVSLPGCVVNALPQSTEIQGSGQGMGPTTQTVSCGSTATLDRYLAGSGSATLTVTDGVGRTVYQNDVEVTGEINDQPGLAGTAGTWSLTVDASGFSGQYKIDLQCY